jgi:predicted dienelactone hydrolase
MAKGFFLALIGLVLALFCARPSGAQEQTQGGDVAANKVGVATRQVLPRGTYNWRGAPGQSLFEVIWYPADGGAAVEQQRFGPPGQPMFQAAPAAPNAPLAVGAVKFPLIMLSHGTGGTVQSMAWFATALAAHGYIVAGVNHPGNTAMAPYTVQGFMLWWLRAKDISVALDDLLADDEFGPRIDLQRMGAAGFSLGGYTVIELAGGITSLANSTTSASLWQIRTAAKRHRSSQTWCPKHKRWPQPIRISRGRCAAMGRRIGTRGLAQSSLWRHR